jgi:hypothetical protein
VIKGYARVSTDGLDLATQHELLKAAGAELVFSEKQSGISDRDTLIGIGHAITRLDALEAEIEAVEKTEPVDRN